MTALDLVQRWFPDAPTALQEHLADCTVCRPDQEELYGVYTCGRAEYILDPECHEPDGTYRSIYGPPIPREVRAAMIAKRDAEEAAAYLRGDLPHFDYVIKKEYRTIIEDQLNDMNRVLWGSVDG